MATYAYPIPNGKVNSEGLTKLISTLYTGSGVVFPDALTVSASGTPDMNVVVSGSEKQDVAVFIGSAGIAYTGWNNTDETVVIDANGSGVTVIDTIVAYIDLAAGSEETANAPGGLAFVAVRGTGELAPTDNEIEAAVGHEFWIRLANVSVANGASSINSGNITDQRTRAHVSNDVQESVGTDQLEDGAVTFAKTSGLWWEELGRHVLESAGSTISVTIPNKRYLQLLIDANDTSLSSQVHLLRFNDDSGSNYAYKRAVDGAADSNEGNITQFDGGINVAGLNKFSVAWVNNGGDEKVIMLQAITSNNAGAATAPRRAELYGKWVNSNPITKVTLTRNSGTFTAGSRVIILGHD